MKHLLLATSFFRFSGLQLLCVVICISSGVPGQEVIVLWPNRINSNVIYGKGFKVNKYNNAKKKKTRGARIFWGLIVSSFLDISKPTGLMVCYTEVQLLLYFLKKCSYRPHSVSCHKKTNFTIFTHWKICFTALWSVVQIIPAFSFKEC
jgi:hypothetical protein